MIVLLICQVKTNAEYWAGKTLWDETPAAVALIQWTHKQYILYQVYNSER